MLLYSNLFFLVDRIIKLGYIILIVMRMILISKTIYIFKNLDFIFDYLHHHIILYIII